MATTTASLTGPSAPKTAIINHPDIKRSLLEMKARVEGIRALLIRLASHQDRAKAAAGKDDEAVAFHVEPFGDGAKLRAGFGGYESVFSAAARSEPTVMASPNGTRTVILFGPSDHVIYPDFDRMAARIEFVVTSGNPSGSSSIAAPSACSAFSARSLKIERSNAVPTPAISAVCR